jgi:type I restriction enzyme S subunit
MKSKELLIEDCFQFIRNGISVKQNPDSGGLPITRIETISKAVVNPNRVGYADIPDSNLGRYENYILKNGDILMSHINSMKYLGKSAIYEDMPAKIIHGMNLLCLRPIEEECFPKYINYFFSSGQFKTQLPKISNQSVNQASFPAGKLKKLKINLPPLETQKRIAQILDDSAALRDKTAQLLKEYDLLAQSIFLDMFGDPVINNRNWKIGKLKKVTSKIGSGSTPRGGKESYHKVGLSLIRSLNIHDNEFKLKDLAFIDDNQAKKLRNVTLEEKDVLINITGASVARCAIVPSEILPARVNQHVSILRCKQDVVNSIFLLHSIISPNSKIKLLGVGSNNAATRESITKVQLETLEVIIPPINLQNQFADKIALIEKQKTLAKQELKEAEDLFNCLLQKAFKGELV